MEGLKYYLTKIDAYLDARPGKARRHSLLKMVDDEDKLIWNLFPEARPDYDNEGFYCLRHTPVFDTRLTALRGKSPFTA